MATTLTYTAGEIANAALRKVGVVAVDRDATAAEMNTALVTFNAFIKALQIPSMMIWKFTTDSITVTDATTSYAIASRPLRLGVVNWRDTSGRDLPMLRLTRKEYYELPDKDAAGTISQFYYHREETQGTLYVWPAPATGTGTIEWEGTIEVDDITATTDALDFPSEWYEAVIYGLADRLCDDFGVMSRKQGIMLRAEQAIALAQSFERESVYFQPDMEGWGG